MVNIAVANTAVPEGILKADAVIVIIIIIM